MSKPYMIWFDPLPLYPLPNILQPQWHYFFSSNTLKLIPAPGPLHELFSLPGLLLFMFLLLTALGHSGLRKTGPKLLSPHPQPMALPNLLQGTYLCLIFYSCICLFVDQTKGLSVLLICFLLHIKNVSRHVAGAQNILVEWMNDLTQSSPKPYGRSLIVCI